jgi:hypothetical protein
VLAGFDVFVTEAPSLASMQFTSFAELARRRGKIIAFHEPLVADERSRFVRRMTRGPQALWRARYLRSQRCGEGIALDAAAIEEVRLALELLGGAAESVTAVAPSTDHEGSLDAAMITLLLDNGAIASIAISAVEPEPQRRTVIACDGRTITIDALDARAPLEIRAASRHRGPQAGEGWAEVISEFPPALEADPVAMGAERFVNAVRARDREATNAAPLAVAAAIWEAARRSIAEGGEPQDLTPQREATERPALRLIAGGGRGGGGTPVPHLTVVRNEPIPFEPASTPA